jgi:rsbT co-antagonist protein RsbR
MKQDIAKILRKKQKQIIDQWMQNQLSEAGLREDLMSNDELRAQSEELVEAILEAMAAGDSTRVEDDQYETVYEILGGISVSRARQGFSPRETGIYIFSLKDAIISVLKQELKNDPEALVDGVLTVSQLVDSFGIVTFETFIKGREEIILRQTDEITDISTPVIRVWDSILALPIIGTLDSQRTQVVMENLLTQIVETGSSIAILDISGVPAVDSLVAQHLIKTVSATRLMGAECIISGIRPEIAQTVVHLGIDLSNIVTKASLASALKYAFSLQQLEVRRKGRPESQKFA